MLKGGIRIETTGRSTPPFPIEAMVNEEDTYLVLSGDPIVETTSEHPIRLLRTIHNLEPVEPGAIIVKAGVPLGLFERCH